MTTFRIKSAASDAELLLHSRNGDHFQVTFSSSALTCHQDVWAYTDADGLARLFERLGAQTRPWSEPLCWASLEREFKLTATCDWRGSVTFDLELHPSGSPEDWQVKTRLHCEFGQLPALAKSARAFFGSART